MLKMNSSHRPSFLCLFLAVVLKISDHNSRKRSSMFYTSMPFIPFIYEKFILVQMIDIKLVHIS